MEQDIGFGEGKTVGVACVGGRERRGGVGVGDDEETGTNGFDVHDWGLEGFGKDGDVRGRMSGMLCTM